MGATGRSNKFRMQTAAVLFAAGCLSACGGGHVANPPPPPVTVTVVGPSAALNTGSSFTLTATVRNASNSVVSWSVVEDEGGSITAAGVYTAPVTPGTYTVKAT